MDTPTPRRGFSLLLWWSQTPAAIQITLVVIVLDLLECPHPLRCVLESVSPLACSRDGLTLAPIVLFVVLPAQVLDPFFLRDAFEVFDWFAAAAFDLDNLFFYQQDEDLEFIILVLLKTVLVLVEALCWRSLGCRF